MKDGWEDWKDKRRWIKRDDKGRFLKGNFHTSEAHKASVSNGMKGHIIGEETRNKIRNSLKGLKFSKKRRQNISIATIRGMKYLSKECKHGIKPKYECGICTKFGRSYNRDRRGIDIE